MRTACWTVELRCVKSGSCYLLQFLASVLLTHFLVRKQHLQQLLHGLLGRLQLLLFKLCAADLTAEGVHGHWSANRIAAIDIGNAINRDLG